MILYLNFVQDPTLIDSSIIDTERVSPVLFFFLLGNVEERLWWPIQSPNKGNNKLVLLSLSLFHNLALDTCVSPFNHKFTQVFAS